MSDTKWRCSGGQAGWTKHKFEFFGAAASLLRVEEEALLGCTACGKREGDEGGKEGLKKEQQQIGIGS
jgi:hypothetical protein